jgi:hypothetical protein
MNMYWRPQTGFKIYRGIAGFLAVLRLVAHLASVVGSERKTELRSVGTSPAAQLNNHPITPHQPIVVASSV